MPTIEEMATVSVVPGLAGQGFHTELEDERKAAAPEDTTWEEVKQYRSYDRGHHGHTLSPQQARILHGVIGRRHADNAVHKVVFEHANRVVFEAWEVANDQVQTYLDDLWVRCRMADFSADRNYATIRDGNHVVGLSWHNQQQRVLLGRERWWDGKAGTYFRYGDDGEAVYAVKEWRVKNPSGEIGRRTVYYEDRIERYINRTGQWEQYILPSDEGKWPVPWVKANGDPLHIPLVHLANMSDADTAYGASILAGGAIGIQDEINDVQRDITVAARMTAYQMYYATGVKPRLDSSGEALPTLVGPGMFFENDSADAKYGVLAAGDMSQLIATHTMKYKTLGNNTATPVHLITGGDWPSGDALVRADKPLADSSKRVVDSVSPSWATVGHRAVELRNRFLPGAPLDENALIGCRFTPTDKPDPLTAQQIEHEKINTLMALKSLGFSTKAILMKYGLSEAEATAMVAEGLAETAASTEAQLGPTI